MLNSLNRVLAGGVVAVAAFNTVAALSLPVRERKPAIGMVVVWLVLLLAHAAVYWFGPRLRERVGLIAYLAAQGALISAFILSGAPFPVGAGLFIAGTAEAVTLAGHLWGTFSITLGAILLFAANAMIAADLYRGATAGLLLATTGVVSHAVAALLERRGPPVVGPGATLASSNGVHPETPELTAREREVLQALVSGARSSQIGTDLGISERTVKAHLASIYRKLGVESRAAAVAVAMQRKLG